MRIFIAIPFTIEVKTKIAAIQKTITKGSLTAFDSLHLTVAFIGESTYQEIDELKEILNQIKTKPFLLEFDHLDSFRNSILYLGSKENENLTKLHKELSSLLEQNNFPTDKRDFKAHITLARKTSLEKTYLKEKIRVKVDRLTIMQSSRINNKLTYLPLYNKML